MIDQQHSDKTAQSPSVKQQHDATGVPEGLIADMNMAPAIAAPAHAKKAVQEQGVEKRAFISKGEKAVNIFNYGLVDWFINASLGVTFAFWGKRTESGQKYWSGPITKFFTNVLEPFIKDPTSLSNSAKYGNMFISIITGGMMTVPMLLGLENKSVKHSMVKFVDRKIYGSDTLENDPKFKQAYQEMDDAPQKKFSVGMYTRGLALAPLLAAVLIPQTAEPISEHYFGNISKGTKWLGNKLGLGSKKLKEVLPGNKESHWDFIHDNFAMDFGLCLPYAALHSYFYNMFAGKPAATKAPIQISDAPIAANNSASGENPVTDTKTALKNAETPAVIEKPAPIIQQKEAKLEHHATIASDASMAHAI